MYDFLWAFYIMKPNVFELHVPISKLAMLGCYQDVVNICACGCLFCVSCSLVLSWKGWVRRCVCMYVMFIEVNEFGAPSGQWVSGECPVSAQRVSNECPVSIQRAWSWPRPIRGNRLGIGVRIIRHQGIWGVSGSEDAVCSYSISQPNDE